MGLLTLRRGRGFTLIELLVVISIIALLVGILLPALGAARRTAKTTQSATQQRGIHSAMVAFAQDNFQRYPGLTRRGQIANGLDISSTPGLGTHPAVRYSCLLDDEFFSGEYLISPFETKDAATEGSPLSTLNYSYAMLSIEAGGGQLASNRVTEWMDTLHTEAAILTDRLTAGTYGSTNTYQSLLTSEVGDWQGNVVWNDNHVTYERDSQLELTRYNYSSVTTTDDEMFGNDPSLDNDGAQMTYASINDGTGTE